MHFVTALDRNPNGVAFLVFFEGVVTGAADGYARMTYRPAATLLHTALSGERPCQPSQCSPGRSSDDKSSAIMPPRRLQGRPFGKAWPGFERSAGSSLRRIGHATL